MGYGWHDFWTTSPAERARKQYREAVEDVQDAMGNLRADLELLRAMVYQNSPRFYGSNIGDASAGVFRDTFEAKVDRWLADANSLMGPIGAAGVAVYDLEQKLALLCARKARLDQMCIEEDAREVEYKSSELPF